MTSLMNLSWKVMAPDRPPSILSPPAGSSSRGVLEGAMLSILRTIWTILLHTMRKRETVLYPEERRSIPPRWRGRIVLTKDPEGQERCVALLPLFRGLPGGLYIPSGRGR